MVTFQGLHKGRNQSPQTQESRNAVLAEEAKSSRTRTLLLPLTRPPPIIETLVVSPPHQGERETGASSKAGLCTPPGVQADFPGHGRKREGWVVAVPCRAQGHGSIFPRRPARDSGGGQSLQQANAEQKWRPESIIPETSHPSVPCSKPGRPGPEWKLLGDDLSIGLPQPGGWSIHLCIHLLILNPQSGCMQEFKYRV